MRSEFALTEDAPRGTHKEYSRMPRIPLPQARSLAYSLSEALGHRKSYFTLTSKRPLSTSELGTLLGNALGMRDSVQRHYPSGGALFPIETYLIGEVLEGHPSGVFHYHPKAHALEFLWETPASFTMSDIVQPSPIDLPFAPVLVVFTSVWSRSAIKYGDLAYSHGLLEAGHMAQNILLTATALSMGARPLSGCNDQAVAKLLDLDENNEQVVYAVLLCPPSLSQPSSVGSGELQKKLEESFVKGSSFTAKRATKVAEICSELKLNSFIDLGCMVGYFAHSVHQKIPSVPYYGFDAIPAYLEFAKTKCQDITFLPALISNLPASKIPAKITLDSERLSNTSSLLIEKQTYSNPIQLDLTTDIYTPEKFVKTFSTILDGSYLKVNIDNMDPLMILQMIEAGADVKAVQFECWGSFKELLVFVLHRLQERGFYTKGLPVDKIKFNSNVILTKKKWVLLVHDASGPLIFES